MSPGKQQPGEDALSLAVAEIKESGTITLAQPQGLEPGQVTSVRLVPKPVIPQSPGIRLELSFYVFLKWT